MSIVTMPVGDPGNVNDPSTGYGSVSYSYRIGEYDVTAGQYTAFLNAVAATDTYGLYNTLMVTGSDRCGIARSGSSGHYTYATTKNPNYPVNYVTFWNAARFANWLNNGQPTGTEDATTSDGTYTLSSTGMANNSITRNASAKWAVSSENEWYKAAYYNPGAGNYYLWATASNTAPGNAFSATAANNANYNYTDPTNGLTAVGAFAASPGPYGTYDQSGDLFNWNDTILGGLYRGLRGGSFDSSLGFLQAGSRSGSGPALTLPQDVNSIYIGFRVSQIPEPASFGIIVIGVAAMLSRRRLKKQDLKRAISSRDRYRNQRNQDAYL